MTWENYGGKACGFNKSSNYILIENIGISPTNMGITNGNIWMT